MTFATRRLADDVLAFPSQLSEMHRQSNPRQPGCGRRPAALSDGKLICYFERQRDHGFHFRLQYLAIGGQNQMVLKLPANCLVASSRRDGKLFGFNRSDLERQIQRQRGRIKGGA